MLIVAYIKEDTITKNHGKNEMSQPPEDKLRTAPSTGVVTNESVSEYVDKSVQNPPDVIMQCHKLTEPTKSVLVDFVECFSVRRNIGLLLGNQKPKSAVPIIDGLKYDHVRFTKIFCHQNNLCSRTLNSFSDRSDVF